MADGAAQEDGGHRSGASDRSSGSRRLLAVAVAFLSLSAFLLYTLVLGEKYLEPDRNAAVEDAVAIATPAVVGLVVGVLALRRARRH